MTTSGKEEKIYKNNIINIRYWVCLSMCVCRSQVSINRKSYELVLCYQLSNGNLWDKDIK
jgi:hypothetical protein